MTDKKGSPGWGSRYFNYRNQSVDTAQARPHLFLAGEALLRDA